jgi:iron-sulfur cluster repair protein YtfE (RIC family)
MKNIFEKMNSDHAAIEKLIDKLYQPSNDHETILNDMKDRLSRHFKWEEEVLFPEFEKKAGEYGRGVIFILKSEHKHIENIFLQNLKRLYSTGGFPEIRNSLFAMVETLKMHKEMEQEVFYPWFKKHLNNEQIKQLADRIKSKGFEISK